MQKAIENYVNIQYKNMVSVDKVRAEINKITEAAIKKAWKNQLRQWRKLNKWINSIEIHIGQLMGWFL